MTTPASRVTAEKSEAVGNTALLPCPFCGSFDIDPEGWGTAAGISGPCCNDCGASVGSALKSTTENIALWNVRPPVQVAASDLLEGGRAQTAIIRHAQSILTQYLEGQPRGLSRDHAIDALLGLLDGPEQRIAQKSWDAAISKAECRS